MLIERFAYNDMNPMEFVTAFPYCTPGLGDLLFDQVYGRDSMHRFVYPHPRQFLSRRDAADVTCCVTRARPPRSLDRDIVMRREMLTNWWRHPGQHSAGLVRHVGGLDRRAGARADYLPAPAWEGDPARACAPALCRTGDHHAWPACGRGQPLHALQSHPDRASGNWRGLDDRRHGCSSLRCARVSCDGCFSKRGYRHPSRAGSGSRSRERSAVPRIVLSIAEVLRARSALSMSGRRSR